MTGRRSRLGRYAFPAGTLLAGVLVLVAETIGGSLGDGLSSFLVFVAVAAAMLYRARLDLSRRY